MAVPRKSPNRRKGKGSSTRVLKKEEAFGAWYANRQGKKIVGNEPSFALEVEGKEGDIVREAVGLARDFDQEAVLVAVYDSAGEGTMFHLDLAPDKVDDRVRAAIVQHFLDAGLGGAISLLDRPSFRFAAQTPAEADIVRKAAGRLPAEFEPKLTVVPARVRLIAPDEYDAVLSAKATAQEETVVAEVIIGGIRPRRGKSDHGAAEPQPKNERTKEQGSESSPTPESREFSL